MKAVSLQRWTVLFLATGLILGLAACANGSRAGRAAPAVRINEEEIPYAEFESYLKTSFGEDVPPVEDAETRSRLLDQFIEERLLLQRAEKERLRVGDEQVEAYLAGLGSGSGRDSTSRADEAALKEQVRRNLLIQEYKDRVLLKDVKVQPSEIEGYFSDHPEEFQQSRVIVLRQILLDDPQEAKRIQKELVTDPAQFPILAQRASLSPDKGQPRPFQEEELPEAVRQAVLSLSPGQVSGEVEDGGKIRIFQMVDRREGKSQSLDEARQKIQVLLLQRKAEEALRTALDETRRSATIQVRRENLPFAYRGDYGG